MARQSVPTEFSASFVEAEGGVLGSYVATVPARGGFQKHRESRLHGDMRAAETWVKKQARLRGITALIL